MMIKTLFQEWQVNFNKADAVLCSVVEWKGSVPRKDYPLMLVFQDGSILGTIGGGSMELKVTHEAVKMIGSKESVLRVFDMTGNDVHADTGLCGGTVKVLIEPFTNHIQAFYERLICDMEINKNTLVLLAFHGSDNVHVERSLVTANNKDKRFGRNIWDHCRQALKDQKTRSLTHKNIHYLLWHPFTPPRIHIFGAGHVGQAVAQLAHFNDLSVKVYDDRTTLLTKSRFPFAERVEINLPVDNDLVKDIDYKDFILITTREHKQDRKLLTIILKQPQRYIGLISSIRKWKILSESLLNDGISAQAVASVRAPVGMDISAQTVPEIAVSILSEMIAVYRSDS